MLLYCLHTIKKHKTPYLFLLPTVILVLGFLISPIFSGISMSLYKARLSGDVTFVGFQNFLKLFKEARFLNNVKLSLLYVGGNLLLSTPLAYIAALLITQKMRAARIFRGIFLLPWITAPGGQFAHGVVPFRPIAWPGYDYRKSYIRQKRDCAGRPGVVHAGRHSA